MCRPGVFFFFFLCRVYEFMSKAALGSLIQINAIYYNAQKQNKLLMESGNVMMCFLLCTYGEFSVYNLSLTLRILLFRERPHLTFSLLLLSFQVLLART